MSYLLQKYLIASGNMVLFLRLIIFRHRYSVGAPEGSLLWAVVACRERYSMRSLSKLCLFLYHAYMHKRVLKHIDTYTQK